MARCTPSATRSAASSRPTSTVARRIRWWACAVYTSPQSGALTGATPSSAACTLTPIRRRRGRVRVTRVGLPTHAGGPLRDQEVGLLRRRRQGLGDVGLPDEDGLDRLRRQGADLPLRAQHGTGLGRRVGGGEELVVAHLEPR